MNKSTERDQLPDTHCRVLAGPSRERESPGVHETRRDPRVPPGSDNEKNRFDSEAIVRPWHPLIRVSAGVFLAVFSAASAVFSSVLVLDPQTTDPMLARGVGIAMVLVSLWLLSTGVRLIMNRPNRGGLLSPLVLRLVAAWMTLFPPLAITVFFKDQEWSMLQYTQACIYMFFGISLWRLASSRSRAPAKGMCSATER